MSLPPDLVPIVDLHFHAGPGWDIPMLVTNLNALGVAQAGNGGAFNLLRFDQLSDPKRLSLSLSL